MDNTQRSSEDSNSSSDESPNVANIEISMIEDDHRQDIHDKHFNRDIKDKAEKTTRDLRKVEKKAKREAKREAKRTERSVRKAIKEEERAERKLRRSARRAARETKSSHSHKHADSDDSNRQT